MSDERIERAAQAAKALAETAIELASDESYAYGMLGGDVGVTDEERQQWRSAPTPDDIAQAVRDAWSSHD